MTSVLIGATSLLTPQSPSNNFPVSLNSSQMFVGLDKLLAVKVSQNTQQLDEKTALNSVWKLPEVQRKAREIERLSKGAIRVDAIVDASPTIDEPYYTIRVFEDEPDHNTTIYWFRVLSPSGTIQVLDILENKFISLEEWKQQLKR